MVAWPGTPDILRRWASWYPLAHRRPHRNNPMPVTPRIAAVRVKGPRRMSLFSPMTRNTAARTSSKIAVAYSHLYARPDHVIGANMPTRGTPFPVRGTIEQGTYLVKTLPEPSRPTPRMVTGAGSSADRAAAF